MSVAAVEGPNWKFYPGFIATERTAAMAGSQALKLFRLVEEERLPDIAAKSDKWGNDKLSVVTVDARKLVASELAADFSVLTGVYWLTEHKAKNGHGTFHIHRYAPEGETGLHVDQEGQATVAVGLIGAAEARIIDPATEEEQTVGLYPTDAIYFNNSVDVSERPLHVVRNTLVTERVSLVN